MEFLEGISLSEKMKKEIVLPLKEVYHIIRQITSAIAFIHSKKIIHRDLKPANIMLIEKDGDPLFVKLLDFGLARQKFQTQVTKTGQIVGTISYMAPEQIT